MNTNHEDSDAREIHEAQLTAFALEQLVGPEREAAAAVVARSEKTRRQVEETSALAGQIRHAYEETPALAPSAALREAVERQLQASEQLVVKKAAIAGGKLPPVRAGRRRRWLWGVVAAGCAACLAVAMIVLGTQERREIAKNYSPAASGEAASSEAYYLDDNVRHSAPAAAREAASASMPKDRMADAKDFDERSFAAPDPMSGAEYNHDSSRFVRKLPDGKPRPAEGPPPKDSPYSMGLEPAYDRAKSGVEFGDKGSITGSITTIPNNKREGLWAADHRSLPQPSIDEFMNKPIARSDISGKIPKPKSIGAGQSVGSGRVNRYGGTAATHRIFYPVEEERRLGERDVSGPGNAPKLAEQPIGHGWGYRGRKPELPPSGPGTEQYDQTTDNPFRSVARQPLSTFSIDVDTASYANVRRFLSEGRLPPPDAVRIEEMVNYFQYNYAPPKDERKTGTGSEPENVDVAARDGREVPVPVFRGAPFAVHLETAECPWRPEHRLVRIGLKGREIDRRERGPSNLVFLLDVSGSMNEPNKLPLVKQAMRMLVEQLEEDDRVAIVTYANGTGVPLPSARGNERKRILDAIEALQAGGGTYGSAGIELAYSQAAEHFVEKGANRVILCTDGDLNIGITNDDDLTRLIEQKAKTGVFLTVLGFGTGNLKDSKMEKLADKGNGLYAYIDSLREARRVLVEQMTGSLITITKDVKIQVEFNPAQVAGYRLVGYENRAMANRDFHDDRKDAGEIGAGHTVTALYEIVPANAERSGEGTGDSEEPLKYQRVPEAKPDRELTERAKNGELLTVRLRYKEPDGVESRMIEFAARDCGKRFGQASADFRFASSVAAFGLVLRGSPYRGSATLAAVEEYAAAALGRDPNGYRAEFLDLVRRAKGLGIRD